ncbi:MAG: hypothetical protein Q4F72_04610 [Desulfovibrionaceae bacterium]|nr:hypothetical protein [Desulfovibrionaceae bacterium]
MTPRHCLLVPALLALLACPAAAHAGLLDSLRETGSEVMDSAKEKGSSLMQSAKETGSELMDSAKEKGSDLADRAGQAARRTIDKISPEKDGKEQTLRLPPLEDRGPAAEPAGSRVTERQSATLHGVVERQRAGSGNDGLVLLTDSGRRIWILGDDRSGRRLQSLLEAGRRVLVTADFVRHENGCVALDAATLTSRPAQPSPSVRARLERETVWQSPAADAAALLLDASWQAAREHAREGDLAKLEADQDLWLKSGLAADAERFGAKFAAMPDGIRRAQSLGLARMARAETLLRNVAHAPQAGTYANDRGEVRVTLKDGGFVLEGFTHGAGSCVFRGSAEKAGSRGWHTVRHDNAADFYALFAGDELYLMYEGTPAAQNCPPGFRFAGRYRLEQGRL